MSVALISMSGLIALSAQVGAEGAGEQQQQEVVDALVSLLDVPAALSAEQRERLFDLLLPLLRPDKVRSLLCPFTTSPQHRC